MPNIIKNLLHYNARRAVQSLGMFETEMGPRMCLTRLSLTPVQREGKESHLFFMTFTPGGPAFTDRRDVRGTANADSLSECSRGLLRIVYVQINSTVHFHQMLRG